VGCGVATFTAPEAAWTWAFDPCTPFLFDVYDYLELKSKTWLGSIPGTPFEINLQSQCIAYVAQNGYDTDIFD